jgi:hypothetical protein
MEHEPLLLYVILTDITLFESYISLVRRGSMFDPLYKEMFLLTIWTVMKSIHDDFMFQIVMVHDSVIGPEDNL